MNKVSIGPNVFGYPMPLTLVGSKVENRANFMAAGWVSRVNANPPLWAVAIGRRHLTADGIRRNRTFSVNMPGEDLMVKADYCGIVSGRRADKARLFEVFYGKTQSAPMIAECPLCLECTLVQEVELHTNALFIGEVVEAYCEEACLSGGQPDILKMKPLVFTMPDNTYWRVGDEAGKAWDAGRACQPGD